MLNEYLRDLMEDMENEINLTEEKDELEFNKYLKTFTPLLEDVQDKILKSSWDAIECNKCRKTISVLSCDFIDGMLPVCKNGCK